MNDDSALERASLRSVSKLSLYMIVETIPIAAMMDEIVLNNGFENASLKPTIKPAPQYIPEAISVIAESGLYLIHIIMEMAIEPKTIIAERYVRCVVVRVVCIIFCLVFGVRFIFVEAVVIIIYICVMVWLSYCNYGSF